MHKVLYKTISYAGKILHNRVLPGYPEITNKSISEFQKQFVIRCHSWAGNFSHPNVEQFYEVVLSSTNGIPMILTELLDKPLTVFVEHSKKTLYVNQELSLCHDMAQGIEYLHSQSLVHGNLHGNNVLISINKRAKIADYLCPLLFSDIVMDNSSGYVAPEVIQRKATALTAQSNIFTLGVLFLQVITNHPPKSIDVSSHSRIEHDIANVSSSHPLLPLTQKCLQNNEMDRPLISDVCNELAQLIEQKESPQMMAYKLLYTDEHVSTEDIANLCIHFIILL